MTNWLAFYRLENYTQIIRSKASMSYYYCHFQLLIFYYAFRMQPTKKYTTDSYLSLSLSRHVWIMRVEIITILCLPSSQMRSSSKKKYSGRTHGYHVFQGYQVQSVSYQLQACRQVRFLSHPTNFKREIKQKKTTTRRSQACRIQQIIQGVTYIVR